jgi:hypothetical protein
MVTLFAGHIASAELARFISDGCTETQSKVSTEMSQCCVRHDMAYWVGGTLEDKHRADSTLIDCIRAHGASKLTAGVWELLLQQFGSSRWGAKWTPKRGFKPLTAEEWREVYTLASAFTKEIPIVRSNRRKSKCSQPVLDALKNTAKLSDPQAAECYDLSAKVGETFSGQVIYSDECKLGYFVFQTDMTGPAFNGFGQCADKIPVEAPPATHPPESAQRPAVK